MHFEATPLPFGKFEFAVTWLYREAVSLPIFLYALLFPDIVWRDGGTYRLHWGGKARRIRDQKGAPVPPTLQEAPSLGSLERGSGSLASGHRRTTTPPELSILIEDTPPRLKA